MKFYKTESKLFGYQIGLNNDNIYIAVPKKYFDKHKTVMVMNNGVAKEYFAKDRAGEATLKDKFKPTKNYTLYYLLWKSYEVT